MSAFLPENSRGGRAQAQLGLLNALKDEVTGQDFYQNLVNNLTELEMVAPISTQMDENHSKSFLQKRSGEILWIMYELYDCTPSKNKS